MIAIGKYNQLKVKKTVDFGVYLDGGDDLEILLPTRYVPENTEVDDELEVFIYNDSEDRIIATTERPLAQVGDFAFLKVVGQHQAGAFLDWGLLKDLFVPLSEQAKAMKIGNYYVVYVYLDRITQRIVASSKIEKYLDNEPVDVSEGQEVEITVYDETPMGYKAVVNNKFSAVLYSNEVFINIQLGMKLPAYIKKIREDEKIDLSIHPKGYDAILPLSDKILQYIKQQGGEINITDHSPAEEIYAAFGISKKMYKKALGNLYKQKMIVLNEKNVQLNK